ncbi:MAG: anthranilate synthase component I [Syntrophobacterales bacterium CG03_land_8_20_14_0_80_58_14]|nr:MAG: anthranilate synthase component I [Syntrophaceae bacterium CG2_30_58_14]PIV04198.1 MAG: anthranilate synthase component I [Syntrophobacterales bacterium CG03_land_8_20_14_0_80_58_14]
MYAPDFETFTKLAKEGNLIPVCREILADTETPVTALMKLADRPHVFLLESVEGGEKWARYSFLGADPRLIFRVRGEEVLIEETGAVRRISHGGDPLRFLKELLDRYRPVPLEGLPRFFGGAVGFLGYDMVRYFERLPAGKGDAPVEDETVFLVTDTLLIFDNVRHTLKIVACAMTGEGGTLREIYDGAVRRIDDMTALLQATMAGRPASPVRTDQGPKAPLPFRSDMIPETFKAVVVKAKEYIAAGDIIQVVLSQRFQRESAADPVDLYRALRHINPSPYMFFLKLQDLHLIGASPEVMVRLEEGVAELKPIAGTRRRGLNEQEDRRFADELLQDPKERAEHVMLVDLGRNDLGRIARIGSVQVNQLMAVERYSHVMHLVSDIQAQLAEGKDAFDVLRATFPAGTLTGAPKVRAMEIIAEMEPSRRGPYGGAVGYFSYGGNMDFCITIRTMLIRDGKVFLQAGAGIVADSDPEAEYQETLGKAEGMVQAVRLAENGFN